MSKYRINMFGTGIRFWLCQIPNDVFSMIQKVQERETEDLENLLFNLEFLNQLGYDHWTDLHVIDSGRGFLLDAKNRIEIKLKSKRLKTIQGSELIHSPLLIDPYKVVENKDFFLKEKGFQRVVLLQMETGKYAQFEMDLDSFDVSKLVFRLNYLRINQVIGESFVNGIEYDNELLIGRKDDMLVLKNRAFYV
jgi:hypothetical protein